MTRLLRALLCLVITVITFGFAEAQTQITAAFGNFEGSNPNGFLVNGSTQTVDPNNSTPDDRLLRLTPSAGTQAGSAFWRYRVNLPSNREFSSHFTFRISNPGGGVNSTSGYAETGADGLVFVIQSISNASGSSGGGIGFEGIGAKSFGVEFDTWRNTGGTNDPNCSVNNSHIGIDTQGSVTSLDTVCASTLGFNWEDATLYHTWVDYNGTTLEIRVSNSATRPATPALSRTMNLSTDLDRSVYFGFSAATGGAFGTHDIESFYFSNEFIPGGILPADDYISAPYRVILTATPLVGSGPKTSTLTATVIDLDGDPAPGITVDFTTTSGSLSPTSGVSDSLGQTTTQLTLGSGVATVTAEIVGGAYGRQTLSFDGFPVVTTDPSPTVGSTTATLSGSVAPGISAATERGICYNQVSGAANIDGSCSVDGATGDGSFSESLTGLARNRTYYYRAYAKFAGLSADAIEYGQEQSFTTLGGPVVTTATPSAVLTTTATLGGTVTSAGDSSITVRGVCYGTTTNPTTSGTCSSQNTSSTGAYTFPVTGLVQGTLYYVRAFATNSFGTTYGSQVTFTTVADTDGDGVPNSSDNCPSVSNSSQLDTDIDGIGDACDTDTDGDGINDSVEGGGDSDGDGANDALDLDTDNDGIPDVVEGATDTDGDGNPNFQDLDSDGDGIPDRVEFQQTSGFVPPVGTDTDGDGIDNAYDPDNGGSLPATADTDGDTVPDYLDPDADGDGIPDQDEAYDFDLDGTPDVAPSGLDANNNGLDDAYEAIVLPTEVTSYWRDPLNGASACVTNSIRSSTRRITKVSNTILQRAKTFAARARACGAPSYSAELRRAAALHRAINSLLTSRYGTTVLVCPTNVCTVTSQATSRALLRRRAREAGTLSRNMKLRAIQFCGSGPETGEEDTRKNSADYLQDLLNAIGRLPNTSTTCPGNVI